MSHNSPGKGGLLVVTPPRADRVDGHPRTNEYLEVLAREAEKALVPSDGEAKLREAPAYAANPTRRLEAKLG